MIEKKIHYVWFGNKKPEKVLKCIESWKKHCPDYEIIEWNEDTFNIEEERKNNKFIDECYKRKLWGFLADPIRAKVLYEYGGIYLDTDVEIVKNFDSLLNTDFFAAHEDKKGNVCFAVFGCKAKHKILENLCCFYENEVWQSPKYISTGIFTKSIEEFCSQNIKENINIYPSEYFYPFGLGEEFTTNCITKNTYAIHWWEKSWGKNPKVYFLKYKHLPFYKKYIRWGCKLIAFYTREKLLKPLGIKR